MNGAERLANKIKWKLWFASRPIANIPGRHQTTDNYTKEYADHLNRGFSLRTGEVRDYRYHIKNN